LFTKLVDCSFAFKQLILTLSGYILGRCNASLLYG
jgi:hypothetical protein